MKRWIVTFSLVALCLCSIAVPASATPLLQVAGGILTGAKGVSVNGVLYDVEFADGSCAALFDGCDQVTDFTFQNQADSESASLALLAQVLIDGPSGNFDSQPELTFGCQSVLGDVCQVTTPYGFPVPIPGTVGITGAHNTEFEALDGVSLGVFFAITDSSNSVFDVFAVWTQSVPSPGTLWCLLPGTFALLFREYFKSRRRAS